MTDPSPPTPGAPGLAPNAVESLAVGGRRRGWTLLLGMLGVLAVVVLRVQVGSTDGLASADVLRGLAGVLGLGPGLEGVDQVIVELRLWRALTGALVGASLGLSGAYLQGLFRNPLAAPGVLGVSSGATLGATVAILLVGGYGPELVIEEARGWAPLVLPVCACLGAFGTVFVVLAVAGRAGGTGGGGPSITTLLLTGVAVNATVGGVFVTLQSLVLDDWEVSQALLSWSFGTLSDRRLYHVGMVGLGLLAALAVLPWTHRELDLFAGGEADAARLGVPTGRVRLLAVAAASVATACAVSAAGAIGFVGLVVPHLVRRTVGRDHGTLLPFSAVGGALLLLGLDTAQAYLLGAHLLPPGVVMALLGGPFFLYLLRVEGRRSGW